MRKWMLSGACVLAVSRLGAVGSGGYTNQVVGAKALSMGNAFTAVADDSSAMFFNPAGLSQLESSEVLLGMALIAPSTEYDPPSSAGESTNSVYPVVPHFYTALKTGGPWTVGLGVNSPYGLETHWDNDGSLRYVATDSRLRFVQITPGFSYELSEMFSLGAGVSYALVEARLSSALNVTRLNFRLGFPSIQADGGKTLEGEGNGWGFTAGALWKPSVNHRFGLTYRSAIESEIEGTTKLSGMAGASSAVFGGNEYTVDTETELNFPSSVVLGYAFQKDAWLFAFDAEWARYSSVKETRLDIKGETDPTRLAVLNTGNPIPREWEDTWNLAFGIERKITTGLSVRTGYFYFDSAIPEATWDPSIPDARRHGFNIGMGLRLSQITINGTASYVLFENRSIENNVGDSVGASVDGTYGTSAPMLSLEASYRF